MKIKRPETEVEVCDICHRDSYLQECKACGKQYCLLCEATVPGCIHGMKICRPCGKRPEVEAISEMFAPRIREILIERDAALQGLPNASGQARAAMGVDDSTD